MSQENEPTRMNKYEEKILKVLEHLLDPTFKIRNDVYLNSLFLHITGKTDTSCPEINPQIYINWLEKSLDLWNAGLKPPVPVVIFALNLTAHLVQTDSHFKTLQSFRCIESFIDIFHLGNLDVTQSLKFAYIKTLNGCLKHAEGVRWILSTDYWKNVLVFILTNQTLYITQEGNKFMANLLITSMKHDEKFTLKIIELLLKPLVDNSGFAVENSDKPFEINEEHLMVQLIPTLSTLATVFEIFLENESSTTDFRVITLFVDNFGVEKLLINYLTIAQSKDLTYALSKVLFLMPFMEIVLDLQQNKPNIQVGRQLATKIFQSITVNIQKGFCENVLKLSHRANTYNRNIHKVITMDVHGEYASRFEHQMMLLEMLPVACAGFRLADKNHSAWEEKDEMRSIFADKIFKLISSSTIRTVYMLREYLFKTPYVFQVSCMSLSYALKSKGFYSRQIGTTAFQIMIYCFLDVIHCIKDKPERLPTIAKEVNFLSLLLESIAAFIVEYKITWQDSVETICVMNLSFDFLSVPTWPPKLVVKALKLMEIAISKYMVPNLALLIDRTNDSTMAFISPLLHAKLHDPSWEVRDSALEVIYTIAYNGATKFPSFRKLLLESDLTTLVVKVALHDGESFVRMTAVKCLQQMIVVSELWDDVKEVQNLHESMLKSMLEETEGIVRKEVVNLITKIYENQLFPHNLIDLVYDTMSHAVISDLYWEVKVNSLGFWEQVIKLHLQNQGMIDGIFPKQTFSKENRKIVNLTDAEIQKRLVKVLHQLGSTGCLSVLVTAIKDECDLEVPKSAIRITQPFLDLLRRYEVTSNNIFLSSPPSPIHINCSSSPHTSRSVDSGFESASPVYHPIPPLSDSIINEILNAKDVNLLQTVYNQDDHPINKHIPLKRRPTLMPKEFLDFTNRNLQVIVEERQNWLKSIDDFDSLLNDILREYNEDDINEMDCY